MNDENLRHWLGANIAAYRKRNRLTQAGLADKLNYSDKAVSKWERGESVPDVMVLVQLADLFGVTVNDLLIDPEALPKEQRGVERVMGSVVEKTLKRKANKNIILGLTSVLVWFVAVFAFVVVASLDLAGSWIAFIYAIPVNAVCLLSLRSAWHDFRWNRVLISAIMWGALLSIYLSLLLFAKLNVWRIFLLGIPGQAAILLWFRLFRTTTLEENHGQNTASENDP